MSSHIVSWRLRRCGLYFSVTSHDMTNAFPSSKHSVIKQNNRTALHRSHALLLDHGRKHMIAHIDALDGEVDMHARAGGLMGDGNAPEEFLEAFQQPLDQWRPAMPDTIDQVMITRPVFTRVMMRPSTRS